MAPKEGLTFLEDSADTVAPRLLGCTLEHDIDGIVLKGKIVETEAYDQTDEASHSFKGKTPRTEVMFGPAGHLYVYFTYGMHYCCNVVVGPKDHGAAVLIRAIEPLDGQEVMSQHRGKSGLQLTNGPAKVCQAFGIDKRHNGIDLHIGLLRLIEQPKLNADQITVTTRIGISRAQVKPWRFYITGNNYVSRSL